MCVCVFVYVSTAPFPQVEGRQTDLVLHVASCFACSRWSEIDELCLEIVATNCYSQQTCLNNGSTTYTTISLQTKEMLVRALLTNMSLYDGISKDLTVYSIGHLHSVYRDTYFYLDTINCMSKMKEKTLWWLVSIYSLNVYSPAGIKQHSHSTDSCRVDGSKSLSLCSSSGKRAMCLSVYKLIVQFWCCAREIVYVVA